jgi:hypothetical protein
MRVAWQCSQRNVPFTSSGLILNVGSVKLLWLDDRGSNSGRGSFSFIITSGFEFHPAYYPMETGVFPGGNAAGA